jgi:hypothetical protein|tara:strand:- start:4053 stop:4322 length:270 start_codon:yes stop_codon:yes gene_type:complete
MKYATKSVLVTRLPRKGDNEFKTASIKLFKINDPHMTDELPDETLEYENVEKIIIKEKEINYFLEGNDIIINDLEEVNVEKEGNIVIIS